MASISKPSRSTRWKTIPLPGGAGRMRIETGAPLWSPTPLHSTAERTVCSCVKRGVYVLLNKEITTPGESSSVVKKPQCSGFAQQPPRKRRFLCSLGSLCAGTSLVQILEKHILHGTKSRLWAPWGYVNATGSVGLVRSNRPAVLSPQGGD